MKRILLFHLLLLVSVISLFFGFGYIDQSRLEKATPSYKPSLFFSHYKSLIEDGGSVYWESFIYRAYENRASLVYVENGENKLNSFQGTDWKWKRYNITWLVLMIFTSFISATFVSLRHNR